MVIKSQDLKDEIVNYHKTKDNETKNKIIDYIKKTGRDELGTALYKALVPSSGKSSTQAGEMIRAVNKIGYRYNNSEELYFEGYGLEQAGSSAVYLSKLSDAFKTLIVRLYPEQYLITGNKSKSYTNFIDTLEHRVVQMVKNNPELVLKRNTINSATDFNKEATELFYPYDQIINGNLDEEQD